MIAEAPKIDWRDEVVPRPMRFTLEPYSANLIAEMRPLWDAHNTEIPQLGLPVDPDLSVYKKMADGKILRIFTARLGGGHGNADSLLVGYQVFFVMKHPHRRYSLEASQDILYLDPEVRRGLVGFKFIKFCDKQLESEGVKVIYHQISAENNFGRIFERMGYKLMDLTFSRRI